MSQDLTKNTVPSSTHLNLAVCDYPEHVDQHDWQAHAEQQVKAGLSFVRLAEFAWSKLEPEKGRFEWDWLDQAMAVYQQHGLKIVLGTPTATPPAWLLQQHPEILPIDEQGRVKRFGSRRHYDHASEVYRKHCTRIVTAMAKRYAQHPAVIGWQIDNELGHEGTAMSFGGASAERFPTWLQQKYQTLEALNEAWGTAFWSQTYSDWQQIQPPNLTAVRQPNPSHMLDYRRFCSQMIASFQQLQVDILRRYATEHFITHNFVIFSAESDLYGLAEPLDFVSWDSYPIGMLEYFASWESEDVKTEFARTGHPDLVSVNHDLYRGLKRGRDFWVMEQQCGHANWAQYNPLPASGAVALWSAQAWAHGASSLVYFRWRACHLGQEILHSGLLRHDGSEDRALNEVRNLDKLKFPLAAKTASVVLLHDYESLWLYDQQPHSQNLSYWRQFMQFYSALRSLGVDVDILHPDQLEADEYRVVIAPALTMMTREVADRLADVAKTSLVLLGPRTACRDATGKVPEAGQLSLLHDLTGCKGGNFESLRPGLSHQFVCLEESTKFHAELWCEGYLVTHGRAIAVYENGPLQGQAAVVKSNNLYTLGALCEDYLKQIVKTLLSKAGVVTVELPDGVRITQRGDVQLMCNFNQHPVQWQENTLDPVSYQLVDSQQQNTHV